MSEKLYEVYWQEIVTHRATVYANSPEEAIDIFKAGEYDEIEYGIETEYHGEFPASVEEQ